VADENLINVEDPEPEPEGPPAPPVAAAPAEPPAPDPPPDEDEHEAIELQGGKFVPLPALKAVRLENKELRTKAAERDQLAQQLAQLQGQVQGYQQVQEQLRRQSAPPPGPAPTDERALAFARGLDLYTADEKGQAVPDVAKAANILSIVKELAKQEAQQSALPVAQHMARQASIQNYQWATTVKDPQGKTIPTAIINEIWKSMPIEATANPDIAKTLVYTAMGMERMNQTPQPAPPAGAPVRTEGVGGGRPARPALSQLEQNIAKERGVDAAKWAEHTKGFVAGRTTVLED